MTLASIVDRLIHSHSLAVYLHPVFLGTLALTFAIERGRPARPDQPVLSSGLAHDAVYFPALIATRFLIAATYVALLRQGYSRWLSGLTLQGLAAWPWGARLALGLVLGDFLAWFHHWLRHRIPLFWRFHAIHHAQRELNVLTDQRYHPVEYLVTSTVRALPMFMLGASVPSVVAVDLLTEAYTKFYHGNVRTNLGPLRWLLVTPQSHRVHHSIEAGHRDHNYGVLLSLWDRIFGTQHPDAAVYPATGIDDPTLPTPVARTPWGSLPTFAREMAHPFRRRRSA